MCLPGATAKSRSLEIKQGCAVLVFTPDSLSSMDEDSVHYRGNINDDDGPQVIMLLNLSGHTKGRDTKACD